MSSPSGIVRAEGRGEGHDPGGAPITVRWHEWLNRDYRPQLHAHARSIAGTHTHEAAVRHLLHSRPTGPKQAYEASAFWADQAGRNRAMLIYALLTRPGTITQLVHQQDAPRLLPDVSKLYTFLREWGIDFKAFEPPPRIDAVGDEHRIVRGALKHDQHGYALDTGRRLLPVQYQPWGEWSIRQDPGPEVPLTTVVQAAHLAGLRGTQAATDSLHEASVRHTGHGISRHGNEPTVPRRAAEAILGEGPIEAASIYANRCRCQFWDDVHLRCGLEPRRPTIPDECPDYTPLEVAWSASRSPHVQRAMATTATSKAAPDASHPRDPHPD